MPYEMNGNSPFTAYVTNTDSTSSASLAASPQQQAPITLSDLGLNTPQVDDKKVKQILRSQQWFPDHPIRTSLWAELCRRYNHGGNNIYQDVIRGMFKDDDHDDSVELPVFVETAHTLSYNINPQGKKAVKRLLCAIASSNPHITFSPVLYALSSLVLHYMNLEEGFGAVYALLQSKEGGFFTQSRLSYEASRYTVKELGKKHLKTAMLYISKQTDLSLETVVENWVWWIFKDLPMLHLVRVIDCLLYEGSKVLYRVALAILQLFHKQCVKHPEELTANVQTAISQFCENIPVSPEKLLKMAFNIRGLTRKSIRALQLQHEMYLRSKSNVAHRVSTVDHPTKKSSVALAKFPRSKSFASNPVPIDEFLTSKILGYDQIQNVWKWLPLRMTVCQPELVYTTEEHGTSIRTLYNKVDGQGPTLVVIQTTNNEVIGAYASADWSERKHGSAHVTFFGTGETFVFTLVPEAYKYEWVGVGQYEDVGVKASMFMAASPTSLTIGGGNGEAITLDEDLNQGFTAKCDTFDNPPLCRDGQFKVKAIEAFAFR